MPPEIGDGIPDQPAKDDFSDASWKIALLLQLPAKGLLLLSGGTAVGWKDPLERRGYRVTTVEKAKDVMVATGMYDAVLHFPTSHQRLTVPLPSLLEAVGPQGQFLGLFRHRLTLVRGVRESVRSLFSRDGVMQWRCDRQLGLAGMELTEFWFPLPNLGNLEELSSADSGEELGSSLGCGRLYRSFFRHCSDGIGIYATRSTSSGARMLLKHVTAGCRKWGMEVGSLRMTRFDLRARGALIAILHSTDFPQELVCRFAYGTATQKRLQRHWDMERMVRAELSRIGMDRKIPGTVAQFDIGEDRCWIEHRINGTISWRLLPRHKDRLDMQLIGFLDALAQIAGDERLATAEEIYCQLKESSEPASSSHQNLDEALRAVRDYLAVALRSESFRYGWVHGDFGYGNAVASPEDGRLEAVIDWETASRKAVIGIDLFNFLIQRSLALTAHNLQRGVSRLITQIDDGWISRDDAFAMSFFARYLPRSTQQMTCLGAAIYHLVRRECQNARVSKWSYDQFVLALEEFLRRVRVS